LEVVESSENRLGSTAGSAGSTMRAAVRRRYGSPDAVRNEEVVRPSARADEVLVRVQAAGVSIGDHHVITGKPYLIRLSPFGGIPRPRAPIPGMALAGRVCAVGEGVTSLRIGDEVFGEIGQGAFAEYVAAKALRFVPKPHNLSFEESAAVPWATAALQGLRDAGGVVAGQHVLINGGSGGVGTWAVQLARAFGAEVTAVCSTRNVPLMERLGASHVIDYTKQDFVGLGARFDMVLDCVGNRSLTDFGSVLSERGTYVACSGAGNDWVGPLFQIGQLVLRSLFTKQKLTTFFATPNRADLIVLKELVEAGSAKPVIERSYPLTEIADALRHVGNAHTQGQTVVRIGNEL
jgi:NADPH:quinone reductase-like Zn-dependent oxidoreductase